MLRLLLVLLWATEVIQGLAISHEDLEGGNRTCDGRSSCVTTKKNRMMDEIDWSEKNCMCDHECSIYGDCCSDSDFFNIVDQRRGMINFECVQLETVLGIYMKTECPPSWEDPTTRKLCEMSSMDKRDPIKSLPATSESSKVTYRNVYCALCHGESTLSKLNMWRPQVECGTIATDAKLTGQDVTSLLQFDVQKGEWVIFHNGAFHECGVNPVIPETPYVRRCLPKMVKTCAVNWTNAEVRSRCEAYTSVVYDGATPYRNPHCAICNNIPLQLLQCYKIDSKDIFFRISGFSSFSILFDLRGGEQVGKSQPCSDGELYDPFFDKCRQIFNEIRDTVNYRMENNSLGFQETKKLEYYTIDNYTNQPEPCQKFLLDKGDYILENKTVYVPLYKTYFQKDDYVIREDETLEICADDLGVKLIDKFGVYMGYVTYAGLGISIIFLILHLVAFVLVPELRNLSGKLLASLCVSLLFAYISFMAAQLLEDGACFADAVITYYCFLASFTWMLTMSFDVWRTLRLATSELRVSAGKQWRKFTIYSLWSWLAPAVIVGTAVFVDTAPEDAVAPEWRPDFGVDSCWFGRKKALWVFFAAPVGVIMALNVTFFGLSANMIYSNSSTTRFTASAGTQRDFRLYARLGVIMGLTWTVGLVAGAFDLVVLWYIFIGLNTLQGLFIFLAFTCTDKVIRALAHRRTDGKPLRPPSFSWSTTDSTRKSHMSDPQTTDTLY